MILLDIDGVLADFVGGVKEILGPPKYDNTWSINEWYGMTAHQFWPHFDGEEFWANLPLYDGALKFYNELLTIDKEVILCTTPTISPQCASGKMIWMQKHFGKHFRDYILTPHKHLFAKVPRTVLIDDYDVNVSKFKANGGQAILVGASYNYKHNIKDIFADALSDLINKVHYTT